MEGSVRYADGRVLITAQLIDPATNLHLWSDSYDREFADIFAIQADVAMNIANAMAAEFSTAEQQRIERVPTESVEAYELYLAARPDRLGLEGALERLDAALELDPEFALAWSLKAIFHITNLTFVPVDRIAAERDAALAAASRAVAIDPDLPEARSALAATRTQRGEWIEAELEFRRIDSGRIHNTVLAHAAQLAIVGHHDTAMDLLSALRSADPLNSVAEGFYILSLAYRGNLAGAEKATERALTLLGADDANIRWLSVLGLLGTPSMTTRDQIPMWGWPPISNIAFENLDTPAAGIAALRARYDREGADAPIVELLTYLLWAAHLGDPEFAMEVLELIVGSRSATNAYVIWAPVLRNVRQLPQFRTYLREIGIVDYWNEFGWPDFCRETGADDFECD
jgi:tetratricopeptide (TPR) repeat protein